jgi:ABC-type polysaccharide/polyol phosphate transport system ATPase subunit
VIEILNVSKKFRIWEDRSRDLKETAINFLRGKRRSYRDIWALKEINVKIREGETVAFIGENGSGKSTLLKLLSGIYAPDEGKIIASGKISALLELGVGFHPDLTGEENIYLNGAMLGFDRNEMKEKFDEIVSFSEIKDFIYSPIRTYSSGMAMRLGFSIAMCVDPDILLIDEVLAVGDEAFQKKCIKRLEDFRDSGKTIILVSHGLDMVERFCGRAVLLHEGKMVMDDIPEKTIDEYHILLSHKGIEREFEGAGKIFNELEAGVFKREEIQTIEKKNSLSISSFVAIREMKIIDREGLERESFNMGETVRIKMIVESPYHEAPGIAIGIIKEDLTPIYGVTTQMEDAHPLKIGTDLYAILCMFPRINLLPGKYIVRGHSLDPSGKHLFDTVEKSLIVIGETGELGVCRLNHQWQTTHEWSSTTQKN